MPKFHPRLSPRALSSAFMLAAVLVLVHGAAAAVLGFREEWPLAGNTDGWGGGSVYANPGTGGVLGNGDGFLVISTAAPTAKLGGFGSNLELAGDYPAAGISEIRLWLNDVGNSDPLEMHVSIGNGTNLWQYNVGFHPPHNQWAEFVVDLTNSANFTHTVGLGTFAAAMGTVDRILIRHDLAPFAQTPDPIQADVGVDHLLLTNGVVGVAGPGPLAPRAPQLALPYPNPSRGDVRLGVNAFEDGAVTLEIVDLAGRRVRSARLEGGVGLRSWVWDGRDAAGRLTAPGVYHVRVSGRLGGETRALVRVR
jgi:FlgD Ig-like domain